MDLELNMEEIKSQVGELAEAWDGFYARVTEILQDAGGTINAEILLPSGLSERVKVEYNYITRVYARGLVSLRLPQRKGDMPHLDVQFGVVGKTGTFYPKTESLDNTFVQLRRLNYFVVWYGGGQKFLSALLAASKKAAA